MFVNRNFESILFNKNSKALAMKRLLLLLFFFPSSVFAQRILTGSLPVKELCRTTSAKVKLPIFTDGAFNSNNIFKVKITLLRESDSTIYQSSIVSASRIHTDTLLFTIPDTLKLNRKSIGERYIVQVISTSPIVESKWSGFFDVKVRPDAPLVSQLHTYCQNETSSKITPNDSLKFKWYTEPQYGIPSYHAPNINTSNIGSYYYYVSEYNICGESETTGVEVLIFQNSNSTPVITSTKTAFMLGEPITLTSTNCANGNLRWSNNLTANPITVLLDSTQVFYSYCENEKCSGNRSNQITLSVTPTTYCIPDVVGLGSNGVGSDTINFNSKVLKNGKSFKGYMLYDASSLSLSEGQSYAFSLQMPKVDYPFYVHVSIWLDNNIDGQFSNESERVFFTNTPITKGDKINGTIVIPNNSQTGLTRMRIRTRLAESGNISSACEAYLVCETEDYTINLSANPCPQLRNLNNPQDNILGSINDYKASNTINASNQIKKNNLPSKANYQAGKSVTLNPGFLVENGTVFKIEIKGCN